MTEQEAVDMYKSGMSSVEIASIAGLSDRTIQRAIKRAGITRSPSERFKNAISRGRMVYHKTPEEQRKQRKILSVKLRYSVLERDNYRCVACGNTSREARIQVDHINGDATDNRMDNLQVLCQPCNLGKAQLHDLV